jgi:hypothetical protein
VAKSRYNKPTLESLVKGQVRIYWNSHKRLFSVQAPYPSDRGVKWIVIGHAEAVQLSSVTFHVSEAGRLRALREGVKNVHAFVRGRLDGFNPPVLEPADRVCGYSLSWDYPTFWVRESMALHTVTYADTLCASVVSNKPCMYIKGGWHGA